MQSMTEGEKETKIEHLRRHVSRLQHAIEDLETLGTGTLGNEAWVASPQWLVEYVEAYCGLPFLAPPMWLSIPLRVFRKNMARAMTSSDSIESVDSLEVIGHWGEQTWRSNVFFDLRLGHAWICSDFDRDNLLDQAAMVRYLTLMLFYQHEANPQTAGTGQHADELFDWCDRASLEIELDFFKNQSLKVVERSKSSEDLEEMAQQMRSMINAFDDCLSQLRALLQVPDATDADDKTARMPRLQRSNEPAAITQHATRISLRRDIFDESRILGDLIATAHTITDSEQTTAVRELARQNLEAKLDQLRHDLAERAAQFPQDELNPDQQRRSHDPAALVEADVKSESARFNRSWVFASMIVLLCAAVLLLVFMGRNRSAKTAQKGDNAVEERVSPFENFDAGTSSDWVGALPYDVVTAFQNAKTIEERLKWVRDPEFVKDAMVEFYTNGPGKTERIVSVKKLSQTVTSGVLVERYEALMSTDQKRMIHVVIGDNGARVDFKCYARYGSVSWPDLLSGKELAADEVRVTLEKGDYYNFGFSDDKKYRAYLAATPDLEDPIHFYAEIGSKTDLILANMVKTLPKYPAVLSIKSVDNSHLKRQFQVVKVRSNSWLMTDQDWEDVVKVRPSRK